MEAARRWLALCWALALAGPAAAQEQARAEEKCHYYAGGQVYPGEAARVPVSDHSLHLSKAKSSALFRGGTSVIKQYDG